MVLVEEGLHIDVVLDGDVESADGDAGDGEMDPQRYFPVLLHYLLEPTRHRLPDQIRSPRTVFDLGFISQTPSLLGLFALISLLGCHFFWPISKPVNHFKKILNIRNVINRTDKKK